MTATIPWLHKVVVQPTLDFMVAETGKEWIASEGAQAILLGTAAIESNLAHIRQIARGNEKGRARGFFQCEPETAVDLLNRYAGRASYRAAIRPFLPPRAIVSTNDIEFKDAIQHNPALGAVLARLKYADDRGALPAWHDVAGQAELWKRHYNASPIGLPASEYNEAFARHKIMPYLEGEFGAVAA